MDTLDNILSGKGEALPEVEKVEVQPEQVKEPEKKPVDPDHVETVDAPDGRKMVPLEALTETRGKVKRYTEQVAEFERRLKQTDDAWSQRFNQLLEKVSTAQPPPPQTDWFADPDAAFQQKAQGFVQPLAQRLEAVQTQMMQFQAEQVFGKEKYKAFREHIVQNQHDPEVRMLQATLDVAPDPISVAAAWFDKRTFDPEAERQRLKAEAKAEALAELAAEQQRQPAQRAPVMPSNLAGARNVGTRSGPAWSGPAQISDILAARK